MNFLKNMKMTVKVVSLVLILQFCTVAVFTYIHNYEAEKRIRTSIDTNIKTVAYAINDFLLRDYHDRITEKDSISQEEYINTLVRLSSFVNKVNVQYIYSLMQYEDKFVFTSTSATNDNFKNNDYELFFDTYETPTNELLSGFNQKDIFYEETKGKYGYLRTIFIPFINKYGNTYIVGVDIEVNDIAKLYQDNQERALQLAAIIFLVSGMISTLLILNFLKPVVLMRNALQEFFDYLNYKRTSVTPVKVNTNDELGEMGHLINENVKIIAANIKKDTELIHEITRISEQVKQGKFSSLIQTEADNPALNDVKNVMNEVFSNMQIVMLDILNLLIEFSKKNYSCKLDNYNLDGEMGKLVVEISVFSKSTSEYMLNKAYDSINLGKDSNFINEHIESLTQQLYTSIKQINELKQTIETTKRFNAKGQESLRNIEEQKRYVDKLLTTLPDTIENISTAKNELAPRELLEQSLNIREVLEDIKKSMDVIELSRIDIDTFISKSIDSINELSQNFHAYEARVIDMKKSVDNTKKISSNLKNLSENMKAYIEESNFDGKENINMLMNNTDR